MWNISRYVYKYYSTALLSKILFLMSTQGCVERAANPFSQLAVCSIHYSLILGETKPDYKSKYYVMDWRFGSIFLLC